MVRVRVIDTPPQEENGDMISDMIADGETQVQPNSAVDNCNIEQEETMKNLLSNSLQEIIEHSPLNVTMGKIRSLLLVPPQKIQIALFGRQIAANGWRNCFLMRLMSMICACT